jgi:hypothetical protein
MCKSQREKTKISTSIFEYIHYVNNVYTIFFSQCVVVQVVVPNSTSLYPIGMCPFAQRSTLVTHMCSKAKEKEPK